MKRELADMSDEAYAKMRQQFQWAVRSSVSHLKRSLLDILDFAATQKFTQKDLLDLLRRRVHNDVGIVGDQIGAAFQIFESGGVIPPFGRTQEQVETSRGTREDKDGLSAHG